MDGSSQCTIKNNVRSGAHISIDFPQSKAMPFAAVESQLQNTKIYQHLSVVVASLRQLLLLLVCQLQDMCDTCVSTGLLLLVVNKHKGKLEPPTPKLSCLRFRGASKQRDPAT